MGLMDLWPFSRRAEPEREERSFLPVSDSYIAARRADVLRDGSVPLSATVAAIAGAWSRGFAMLDPNPDPNPLGADVLAAVGLDLCLRGQSVWHLGVDGSDLTLRRASSWAIQSSGRYALSIPHPHGTETVRALDGEVLNLRINAPAAAPWQGRSPFSLMGGSPALLAEIESAVSGAVEWVGRGLLPFPDSIPAEQQAAALSGLKSGGRLAVVRSKEEFAQTTGAGRTSEFRRVELGPDLERADLSPIIGALHNRLLAAAGIPGALFAESGNAGSAREAYRALALQTIAPIARGLLPELRKIGVTSLSTGSMLSADVAGRARAVSALVGAGMDLNKALALVGWEE